ncbi:MAG: hypothetical protein KIS78_22020 [Labilithrix sp.]|nr:hypothetical protein [Labilithrix sp.]MCW5835093.1 hypothetical protein [Labilithrix sp.]
MTASISIFPRANEAPRASGALARLARLEQVLDTAIAACGSGSEHVQEGALTRAVASVAYLFGAHDPSMPPRMHDVMADAYDACLHGLTDACVGDLASLSDALLTVRSLRRSLESVRPAGPSTMPRAA